MPANDAMKSAFASSGLVDLMREETTRREREDADILALSLQVLAGAECPDDVMEFGKRHRLPTFAEATWKAGYIAGFRAAARARTGE